MPMELAQAAVASGDVSKLRDLVCGGHFTSSEIHALAKGVFASARKFDFGEEVCGLLGQLVHHVGTLRSHVALDWEQDQLPEWIHAALDMSCSRAVVRALFAAAVGIGIAERRAFAACLAGAYNDNAKGARVYEMLRPSVTLSDQSLLLAVGRAVLVPRAVGLDTRALVLARPWPLAMLLFAAATGDLGFVMSVITEGGVCPRLPCGQAAFEEAAKLNHTAVMALLMAMGCVPDRKACREAAAWGALHGVDPDKPPAMLAVDFLQALEAEDGAKTSLDGYDWEASCVWPAMLKHRRAVSVAVSHGWCPSAAAFSEAAKVAAPESLEIMARGRGLS